MRNLVLDDDDPMDMSNVADASVVLQDADGNEYTAIISRGSDKKKENILAKSIQERSSSKSSSGGSNIGTKVGMKTETKVKVKADPLPENIRKLIHEMIQEILGELNIAPGFMKKSVEQE